MAEIVLDDISKRFADGTEAVKRTSLTIADGEFFILVGPSGCGKSTLLNIIIGLTGPSSGEVRVDGVAVTGRDPKDRNMAMVFQSYAIYPHMTVRDNIAFPLRLAKLAKDEIAQRVARAAELLELEALLDRRPAELSGGQRQRVAMGRAIVREPAAFLLDEPLSNLDAKLRVQMRNELARLHARLGTTTVYVTHDQTEAMTLGERIAVLRDGRVQQVGTPRELYDRPANLFVAGFVGAPAMNFVPGEINGDRLRLPMTTLDLPEGMHDHSGGGPRAVIVGIRPEHLADAATAGAAADGRPDFEVRVERVEWLGADQFVYFDWPVEVSARLQALREDLDLGQGGRDEIRLVARVAAASHAEAGKPLRLALDPARLSLFDADSGRRIAADDAAGATDRPSTGKEGKTWD
jgi:multiple sugar transport system ATP-binding protein